jgi:hypothetical protein
VDPFAPDPLNQVNVSVVDTPNARSEGERRRSRPSLEPCAAPCGGAPSCHSMLLLAKRTMSVTAGRVKQQGCVALRLHLLQSCWWSCRLLTTCPPSAASLASCGCRWTWSSFGELCESAACSAGERCKSGMHLQLSWPQTAPQCSPLLCLARVQSPAPLCPPPPPHPSSQHD